MSQEYIDKHLAAKRSGKSVRRLLELAALGRVRKEIRRDPKKGNREIALFHAGDIEKMRTGQTMALQRMLPPGVPLAKPLAASSLPSNEGIVRPWMTLAEAEAYTGLPGSVLENFIKIGRLPALDVGVRPGGRWRVSRRDLDAISADVRLPEEQKAKVATGRA